MGNRIWPLVSKINKRILKGTITREEAADLILQFPVPACVVNEAAARLGREFDMKERPELRKRPRYPVMTQSRHSDGHSLWHLDLHPTKGWRWELVA